MQLHPQQWVVNAISAKQLIEAGATVLDVRSPLSYICGHVPGAVRVTWQQFSQNKSPHKGKLLDNSEVLEQELRQLGISNDLPVIVVGNLGQHWHFGEEGRIVWMLHTLGHLQAAFVDGGQQALVKVGVPSVWGISHAKVSGDFRVQRTTDWEIDSDELKTSLSAHKLIAIDTRESREYAGATPYGEKQGGHIPGAVHFYFKDLLDDGCLLSAEEIALKLNELGITKDSAILAYCTGGIRSAFFVAVLVNLGFTNVKNYPGSMWEWSEAGYPLTKEP